MWLLRADTSICQDELKELLKRGLPVDRRRLLHNIAVGRPSSGIGGVELQECSARKSLITSLPLEGNSLTAVPVFWHVRRTSRSPTGGPSLWSVNKRMSLWLCQLIIVVFMECQLWCALIWLWHFHFWAVDLCVDPAEGCNFFSTWYFDISDSSVHSITMHPIDSVGFFGFGKIWVRETGWCLLAQVCCAGRLRQMLRAFVACQGRCQQRRWGHIASKNDEIDMERHTDVPRESLTHSQGWKRTKTSCWLKKTNKNKVFKKRAFQF